MQSVAILIQTAEDRAATRAYSSARLAGAPPLTIFACTIPTEGAPSLRFLQGWAAMLRLLFDFVVDT